MELYLINWGGRGAGSNISNMRDSDSLGYPKTEKRVENMTPSEVFLKKFKVFRQPMKHCLKCLMYVLSVRNKWRTKIVKIYAN